MDLKQFLDTKNIAYTVLRSMIPFSRAMTVDLAAMKTVQSRGRVYVVPREEMPCREVVAAVYRY